VGIAALEDILVPVPALDVQRWVNELQTKVEAAKRVHAAASVDLDQLLPTMLAEVFG